jgi:sporulation protein YlmC with PRC-barrel domain
MSEVDLAFGLLDHQIVDSDGRRCGKVDDLSIEGGPEETPVVTAILVGPGAWKGRGRLARLVSRFAGDGIVRVPWADVDDLKSAVELKKSAGELGLGRGDDRVARWTSRLPGA